MTWTSLPDYPVVKWVGGTSFRITTKKDAKKSFILNGTPCKLSEVAVAETLRRVQGSPETVVDLIALRERQFTKTIDEDNEKLEARLEILKNIPPDDDLKKYMTARNEIQQIGETLKEISQRALYRVVTEFL
eukprot:gene19656-26342_t